MTRCVWTDPCTFFTDEVGYSIELQAEMRSNYCMGDNTHCARLAAIEHLPFNKIPDDLMPTEHERLAEITDVFEREICERCCQKHDNCGR